MCSHSSLFLYMFQQFDHHEGIPLYIFVLKTSTQPSTVPKTFLTPAFLQVTKSRSYVQVRRTRNCCTKHAPRVANKIAIQITTTTSIPKNKRKCKGFWLCTRTNYLVQIIETRVYIKVHTQGQVYIS